jgi:hypothetical protein
MTEIKRFEEYAVTSTPSQLDVELIKGGIGELNFEGGDEPLVVLTKKINELVKEVNALKKPLYVVKEEVPLVE